MRPLYWETAHNSPRGRKSCWHSLFHDSSCSWIIKLGFSLSEWPFSACWAQERGTSVKCIYESMSSSFSACFYEGVRSLIGFFEADFWCSVSCHTFSWGSWWLVGFRRICGGYRVPFFLLFSTSLKPSSPAVSGAGCRLSKAGSSPYRLCGSFFDCFVYRHVLLSSNVYLLARWASLLQVGHDVFLPCSVTAMYSYPVLLRNWIGYDCVVGYLGTLKTTCHGLFHPRHFGLFVARQKQKKWRDAWPFALLFPVQHPFDALLVQVIFNLEFSS